MYTVPCREGFSTIGGRTLAEVRDAAGHSNVSITSGYLHVAVGAGFGELFGVICDR